MVAPDFRFGVSKKNEQQEIQAIVATIPAEAGGQLDGTRAWAGAGDVPAGTRGSDEAPT